MTLSFLPFLCATALAQEDVEGVDGHGSHLTPSNDGEVLDPLELWRARSLEAGTFGVQGLFEYADAPLVFVSGEDDVGGGTSGETAVLDDIMALNLAASFAPIPD